VSGQYRCELLHAGRTCHTDAAAITSDWLDERMHAITILSDGTLRVRQPPAGDKMSSSFGSQASVVYRRTPADL